MSNLVQFDKHKQNNCLAVFGGDRACLRSVVLYWSGKSGARLSERITNPFQLRADDAESEITIIPEYPTLMSVWPGGPMVWLLPERGPSEPELAQMRQFLSSHHGMIPSFVVLFCIPSGTPKEELERDLDIVSETLYSGIEFDADIYLEAVWLQQDDVGSLGSWLTKLRDANGKQ